MVFRVNFPRTFACLHTKTSLFVIDGGVVAEQLVALRQAFACHFAVLIETPPWVFLVRLSSAGFLGGSKAPSFVICLVLSL